MSFRAKRRILKALVDVFRSFLPTVVWMTECFGNLILTHPLSFICLWEVPPKVVHNKGIIIKIKTNLLKINKLVSLRCARRDSNPHASRHQILSLARLPITPRAQCFWLASAKVGKKMELPNFYRFFIPKDRRNVCLKPFLLERQSSTNKRELQEPRTEFEEGLERAAMLPNRSLHIQRNNVSCRYRTRKW